VRETEAKLAARTVCFGRVGEMKIVKEKALKCIDNEMRRIEANV
jgi:hypothetical protein